MEMWALCSKSRKKKMPRELQKHKALKVFSGFFFIFYFFIFGSAGSSFYVDFLYLQRVGGSSPVAVLRLLMAVASPVAKHRL